MHELVKAYSRYAWYQYGQSYLQHSKHCQFMILSEWHHCSQVLAMHFTWKKFKSLTVKGEDRCEDSEVMNEYTYKYFGDIPGCLDS